MVNISELNYTKGKFAHKGNLKIYDIIQIDSFHDILDLLDI